MPCRESDWRERPARWLRVALMVLLMLGVFVIGRCALVSAAEAPVYQARIPAECRLPSLSYFHAPSVVLSMRP